MRTTVVAVTLTALVTASAGYFIGSAGEQGTVPSVCIEALDSADRIMGVSVDYGHLMVDLLETTFPDSVNAAYDRDGPAMRRATEDLREKNRQIGDLTVRLSRETYGTDAQACRGTK